MFSIGEFSQATGLTVKALRFYHEQGLLAPACVDRETGYRYYRPEQVDLARVIGQLRELGFSLAEIGPMLAETDDGDLLEHLERRRQAVAEDLRRGRETAAALDVILRHEREARSAMQSAHFEIVQRTLEPLLIAGIRTQGRYADCGPLFGRIARRCGRHLAGKPMLLHYNAEYREDDADFEACFPLKRDVKAEGLSVRTLPGGAAICLMHLGPYEQLSRSYAKLMEYAKAHRLSVQLPTREIYHKGPGRIFRGNPKKYLTEIVMLVLASGR